MRQFNNVIGLIPCAGEGKRLGFPYPKELFPDLRFNQYRPIFMNVFDSMTKIVKEIVIVIDDQRTLLINYLKKNCPDDINIYFVLQKEAISLPHAILQAYPLIKNKHILFGMPDTVIIDSECFENIYTILLNSNCDLVCGCFKTSIPEKFGMVEFKNESNLIKKFIDKPKNYTNSEWMWGILAWSPKFTTILKKDFKMQNYNLTDDTMNIFAEMKKAIGIKFENTLYYDLGTREEIVDFIRMEVK